MHQVNIHAVKRPLSRLVDMAAQGLTVTIAKAGKPVAKVESMTLLSYGAGIAAYLGPAMFTGRQGTAK